ncbi:prostaglandin E2 receptor EP3 subtype-like [Ptychodera flava]|uniref:prostaglandin E2 receptor EP3 subtype-like n=1 Tax=Ptychodera flava TaxID=63121 RepID=UPI00396A0E64
MGAGRLRRHPAGGWLRQQRHTLPGHWCFFNWFSRDTSQRLYASLFVAVVLGVMIGVTGSTASVGITIRIRHRGRRNSVTEMKPERRKGKGDGKAAVEMVLLLTGFISVFIACWTPLIMKILVDTLEKNVQRNNSMELIAFRLAMARFCLNPLVFLISRAQFVRKHCCVQDGDAGSSAIAAHPAADGDGSGPEESCCDCCCSSMRWTQDGELDSRFSYFSSGRTVYGGELSGCNGQSSADANAEPLPPSSLDIHREVSIPGTIASPRVPRRTRHKMEVTVNV